MHRDTEVEELEHLAQRDDEEIVGLDAPKLKFEARDQGPVQKMSVPFIYLMGMLEDSDADEQVLQLEHLAQHDDEQIVGLDAPRLRFEARDKGPVQKKSVPFTYSKGMLEDSDADAPELQVEHEAEEILGAEAPRSSGASCDTSTMSGTASVSRTRHPTDPEVGPQAWRAQPPLLNIVRSVCSRSVPTNDWTQNGTAPQMWGRKFEEHIGNCRLRVPADFPDPNEMEKARAPRRHPNWSVLPKVERPAETPPFRS